MDKDTAKFLLYLIAGVGAVYLLYQFWQKAAGAVASVTAPATTALANWYVALTSSGAAIPTGYILLPDGVTSIPVASVTVTSPPGSSYGTFTYNGATYYINAPHDANGNWAASLTPGS